MSATNTSDANYGKRGFGQDAAVKLLFDDNTSLKTSERALEAAPLTLQMALNECRSGGSMRLSRDSYAAWKLVLQHMESAHPSPEFLEDVCCADTDTIVEVVRLCQLHGITCLQEVIDEATAEGIKGKILYNGPQIFAHPPTSLDSVYKFSLCERVKQIEMVKSEDAMVSLLVRVATENEEWLKEFATSGRPTSATDWKKYIGSLLPFIDEMHEAKRYRFCSFFAKRLAEAKFDASVYCNRQ